MSLRCVTIVKLTLVLLGLGDHALALLLRQTVVVAGETIGLAGSLVGSGVIQDTVSVDVEGALDLRNMTRRNELEHAEQKPWHRRRLDPSLRLMGLMGSSMLEYADTVAGD